MQAKQKGQGRLVAIVVTHNRLSKLQVTVTRLLDAAPEHLERLIVVDNASSAETGNWLSQQTDPRLEVLRSETNLGGAGGFEHGMRHAVAKCDPDWLVVMDDDAHPMPGVIERFHNHHRSDADAWAAAVYLPDGEICDMNRPSINPFWHPKVLLRTVLGRGRDGFHLTQTDYEASAPREIDGTSFVGFFISRDGVARAGFPDGRLFLYGDDVLYTLNLTKRGGRILFDPSLHFTHDFSTISQEDRRFRPLWKSYYHYRNLLIVYRLCSGWLSILVLPAAVLKWTLKVRHHSGERRAFLWLLFWAVRDAITGRLDMRHEDLLACTASKMPKDPET